MSHAFSSSNLTAVIAYMLENVVGVCPSSGNKLYITFECC